MTDYEAIFKRKSFHLFRGTEPFTEEDRDKLLAFLPTVKALDASIRTRILLVPAEETSCRCGASYCLLFYSEKKANTLRNIGYIGEQIDLFCAKENIGTVWFGLGKVKEPVKDGLDFIIMMALDKVREDAFRKEMFKARRKPLDETWQGEPLPAGEIARFAPSACNSQPWRVKRNGGELAVYRHHKNGRIGIMSPEKANYFNRIDMGIYLCILEVCLAHDGLTFTRTLADDTDDTAENALTAVYRLEKTV